MKKYTIHHRIKTVTSNWVSIGNSSTVFSVDTIKFEQEFTLQDGPSGDYWIASSEVEANTWQEAIQDFTDRLVRIASRISLIGQGYIDFIREPFLIRSSQFPTIAFFRNVLDRGHVGLSFFEKHKLALEKLLLDQQASDEFYLYWNDATNTTGYSAKLLLMFAAIEALVKKRDKPLYSKPDEFRKKILGDDLYMEIYPDRTGLRNRLTHGEYLDWAKDTKDYVAEVHKKVVIFINTEVLKDNLIDEDVVQPQRNFNENKTEWKTGFLKKVGDNNSPGLSLEELIAYFNKEDSSDFYSRIGHGEEFDELNKDF